MLHACIFQLTISETLYFLFEIHSQIWASHFTVISNDDLIIDYTTEEDDKSKVSHSFGNSHVLPIHGTVSKIIMWPKDEGLFKIIAARIYSTETEIEIPLLEETLVRLGFARNCNYSDFRFLPVGNSSSS